MNRNKLITATIVGILLILAAFSFTTQEKAGQAALSSKFEFQPALKDYKLFAGKLSDLTPAAGVEVYELTTSLFADYAEKKRMIKLPAGTSLRSAGNGLPLFPDGAILVKTFYYYKDKRNPELGRNILETRLLIKDNSKWHVGTYRWNKEQTAATLINKGTDVKVDWIDINGKSRNVYFQIPSKKECSVCHKYSGKDAPLGPKLRNLNIDITGNGAEINQLRHFQNIGWLNTLDVKTISVFPHWEDNSYTLEERARAYLDVNCSSCHNPNGSASNNNIYFEFETPFDETGILEKKKSIIKRMQSEDEMKRMPKLGVTVNHTEGFELVKQYIDSL